jgi:hypothetical protein
MASEKIRRKVTALNSMSRCRIFTSTEKQNRMTLFR